MSNLVLKLDERKVGGKKVAKLRHDGHVPSVMYGGSIKPISTQSQLIETLKIVRAVGKHTPISIEVDGKKHLAIIKSIDFDPVRHELRHLAFHVINQNEKIVTTVQIELDGIGESLAERSGLVILQAIESVEVRALPANLPSSLNLSVALLVTDEDKLTLADIQLPENVEFADHDLDLDLVVANVYEPSALQAANEAAGGDAEAEDALAVESEEGAKEPEEKNKEA